MISANASNWVDRGEPAEPKIAAALRHFLGFNVAMDDASLLDEARTLLGMVAADASEIQVASYLGYLEDQVGRPRSEARTRRLEAIAIWHIGKAALTRDRALSFVEGRPTDATVDHERLSQWLAARIAPDAELP
jgi:hypothetical protein